MVNIKRAVKKISIQYYSQRKKNSINNNSLIQPFSSIQSSTMYAELQGGKRRYTV